MDNAMKDGSEVITFTDIDADRQTGPRIIRALVVDNDDHIRKTHEDILKTLGVETRSVKTGQEALEIISYDRIYDLILIRRTLPVKDGIEVTKMLRSMEYPGTIIGVSHYPLTEEQAKEFYRAGLDGCIDYETPLRDKTVESLVSSIPPPQPWQKRVNYNVEYNSFFRPDSPFRFGQIYHSSSGPGSGSSSCKSRKSHK
ncbi:two-component response regulator ARR22-like [Vicia villosa]|uniref:two-component response regulator ARR22-like n=1 Tax=Vicia villosa TaxID=3911 RepID=UPI00273AB436|nr:two-component response regulator ARR22-like [Vicia villosa]